MDGLAMGIYRGGSSYFPGKTGACQGRRAIAAIAAAGKQNKMQLSAVPDVMTVPEVII
jgi:hypothetical protein